MKTLEDVEKYISLGKLVLDRFGAYLSHSENGTYIDEVIAYAVTSEDPEDYKKFYISPNGMIAYVTAQESEFTFGLFQDDLTPEAYIYVKNFIDKVVRVFEEYLEQFYQ